MKKIITSLLLFILVSMQSQTTTIAIEDYSYYNTHPMPSGTIYAKDINHVLDKYVGTWQGSFDNKTMTIFATKETQTYQFAGRVYMRDYIAMRYVIRNATTNAILADTTNEPLDSTYIIEGLFFDSNGWYNLLYTGLDADCGQQGELYITTYNNDLNMKMVYAIDDLLLDGESCPNGRSADILRVTETMYFTKQ